MSYNKAPNGIFKNSDARTPSENLTVSKSVGGEPGTCTLHIFKMLPGNSDIG